MVLVDNVLHASDVGMNSMHVFSFHVTTAPQWAMAARLSRLHDHAQTYQTQ